MLYAGVRVNCVAPGLTWLSDCDRSKEETDFVGAKSHLVGRAGRADEIANVAALLLSDESSFVTGVTWHVDGGPSIGERPDLARWRAMLGQ
jgi:NAD(P)-dependent dehydrogenase (short-subunit alcohol dehydrogenase family)